MHEVTGNKISLAKAFVRTGVQDIKQNRKNKIINQDATEKDDICRRDGLKANDLLCTDHGNKWFKLTINRCSKNYSISLFLP